MGCAHKQNQDGFTLVEIAIVMIIVGLLIGGTFGGMKLIENMQVNRTIQDLKAIESGALTFRDTYGRLPGDLRNPSARLPNCTTAPCSTTGNGDRRISPNLFEAYWGAAQDTTFERYTFWHHLSAADILNLGVKNTLDMEFGQGQPESPLGGGYRVTDYTSTGWPCNNSYSGGIILVSGSGSTIISDDATQRLLACSSIESIDRKMDDGEEYRGKINGYGCSLTYVCNDSYTSVQNPGWLWYDAGF